MTALRTFHLMYNFHVIPINKLTPVFYASVHLLMINFIITSSMFAVEITRLDLFPHRLSKLQSPTIVLLNTSNPGDHFQSTYVTSGFKPLIFP